MNRTIVIGLTGGIATGKSTVAGMLLDRGGWIFDADGCVHALLAPGGKAEQIVMNQFPQAIEDGKIDRSLLGKIIFADAEKRKQLEAILHPMVKEEELVFIENCRRENAFYAVLEIPLLFESGADVLCDITVTTECPYDVQMVRALERPHMSKEKFEQIFASQMTQEERRAKADWVITTGMNTTETRELVDDRLRAVEDMEI